MILVKIPSYKALAKASLFFPREVGSVYPCTSRIRSRACGGHVRIQSRVMMCAGSPSELILRLPGSKANGASIPIAVLIPNRLAWENASKSNCPTSLNTAALSLGFAGLLRQIASDANASYAKSLSAPSLNSVVLVGVPLQLFSSVRNVLAQ